MAKVRCGRVVGLHRCNHEAMFHSWKSNGSTFCSGDNNACECSGFISTEQASALELLQKNVRKTNSAQLAQSARDVLRLFGF